LRVVTLPGSLVGAVAFQDRADVRLENAEAEALRWTQLEFQIVDANGDALIDAPAVLDEVELRTLDGSQRWPATVTDSRVVIGLDRTVGADAVEFMILAARANPAAGYRSFAFAFDEGTSASAVDLGDVPINTLLIDEAGLFHPRLIVGASTTAPTQLVDSAHTYPNPYVPSRGQAVVAYTLAGDSEVQIEIYDLLGNAVRRWNYGAGDPQGSAGLHDGDVMWDGRNGRGEDVRSGVYVCRLRAEGQEALFKIAVTR